MKLALSLLALTLTLSSPHVTIAADAKAKAKPYPLSTCLVSDEKLGADSNMKPYVFVEDGQEIKLCCKSCLKDFKKDKASLLKKLASAEKKAK